MVEQADKPQATEAELQEMIAATDTGARSPAGGVGKLIIATAFSWSVFQLWIASPLPYMDALALPIQNSNHHITGRLIATQTTDDLIVPGLCSFELI